MAFIFLFEAYDSLFFFKETQLKMSLYGLNVQSDLLLYAAIFLLALGGLMVLAGYRSSLGAFLLLCYWVPLTFIIHDFWNVPFKACIAEITCPEINLATTDIYRRMQAMMFMKNLAIIGGLLMVLVNGSGKYSVRRLFATTKVLGT